MKRSRISSLLAFVLALILAFATGCQPQATPTAAPTPTQAPDVSPDVTPVPSWKLDNSTFQFDWFVDLSWWSWNGDGWGKDMVSQIIQEKTGAEINFIVPATDTGEQLSTYIASNSLPDVITVSGWWDAKIRKLTNQMATEGYIWAMNDLIDQHAPTMWDVVRMDMFNWHAEKDGKTYLFQNYSYSDQDLEEGEQLVPNGCLTIRKDLYEAIGSPDMTTPEAFLAACEKVRDEIKTYNGQDIIPIQLYEGVGNSLLWLSQYFATPFEDESGNYLYDFTQPNYKDSLKFLNSAYRMGLITESNFSDTRDLVNEKIASGKVFALFSAPQDFVGQFQALYDADPNAINIPVVLKNYRGEDPVLQDIRGFGWLNTAITKKAEKPDRIIRLFEYLISDEGQIDVAYGKEGETYTYAENGDIVNTQAYLDDVAAGNAKKYALGALMMLDNWAFRRKFHKLPPSDQRTLLTADTYIKEPVKQYSFDYNPAALKLDPTDPRTESMNNIATQIGEYRKQAVAEVITAKDDAEFEARYAAAIEELKRLGLDDLVAYRNDGFQAAKEALGLDFGWPPLRYK